MARSPSKGSLYSGRPTQPRQKGAAAAQVGTRQIQGSDQGSAGAAEEEILQKWDVTEGTASSGLEGTKTVMQDLGTNQEPGYKNQVAGSKSLLESLLLVSPLPSRSHPEQWPLPLLPMFLVVGPFEGFLKGLVL